MKAPAILQVQLPLFCVLFVMLVEFMLFTTWSAGHRAYDVRVGRVSPTARDPATGIPALNLLADRRCLVNGVEVNRSRLVISIRRRIQAAPGPLVILEADDGATYQDVIAVIDAVHRAGGQVVVPNTRAADGPQALQGPGSSPRRSGIAPRLR
jgi:biopolymer transport protein ExbD